MFVCGFLKEAAAKVVMRVVPRYYCVLVRNECGRGGILSHVR